MERGEGAEGTPGISSSGLEILLPSRDAGKAHTSGFLLHERVHACVCVSVSMRMLECFWGRQGRVGMSTSSFLQGQIL